MPAGSGLTRPSGGWNRSTTGSTAEKMADQIRLAMAGLPARQREVVTLRDIEGMSSEEVCSVLEITEINQRVLLHRGRSRLRQVLESEFGRA